MFAFFVAFIWLTSVLFSLHATPLDDYVNMPDPTFNWTVKTIKKSNDYTLYVSF
jgi:hypothetical protein